MTINDANRILDRIREGYAMSLAITTQALQRTGDIPDFPDKPLRTNGDEPKDDRTGETQNSGIKEEFSYSRYLDSEQNQGVKE
jgi:hypothetical protein